MRANYEFSSGKSERSDRDGRSARIGKGYRLSPIFEPSRKVAEHAARTDLVHGQKRVLVSAQNQIGFPLDGYTLREAELDPFTEEVLGKVYG